MDTINWLMVGSWLLLFNSALASASSLPQDTASTESSGFDHMVSIVLVMLLVVVCLGASLPQLCLYIANLRRRRQDEPHVVQPDDVSLRTAYIPL